MTKTEYLKELKKYLKRLPKADYENAMEHFTEYFEEAGIEGEQDVIKELGTPREAASELLRNLLKEDLEAFDQGEKKEHILFIKEKKIGNKVKKTSNSVGRKIWISCLVIMAAPIALPLALTGVVCFLTLGLFLCCVLIMIGALSLASVLIGAKLFLRGIVAIPYSISGAGMIIGMGFIGAGLGIFFCIFTLFFYQWMKKVFLYFIQKIANRKKNKRGVSL